MYRLRIHALSQNISFERNRVYLHILKKKKQWQIRTLSSQRVRTLQKNAIGKLITTQRVHLPDDPFTFALSVAREARCPAARYIDALREYSPEAETAQMHQRIRQSARS
jgi:hypothetical protein